ncbi:MAG: ATP-binding protein [Alphaproteobacteria bacterium]
MSDGNISREDLQRRVAALEAEVAALRAGDSTAHMPHFFEMIEASPLGVVVHRGGPPLYANHMLASMIGMPRGTYLEQSTSALDWVYEQDRGIVASYVARFIAGEALPATGAFRMVRADGSTFLVESHTTRVIWDGEPAVASALTDVTDRHGAEREVQQSRKLFQAIFDATPDVVTVTDLASGNFVDVNAAFLMHSQHDRDAIVGRSPDEVGIYGDRAFRSELVRRVNEDGSVSDIETTAHTQLGERVFTVSANALSVDGRRLLLAIGRDTTEWRRQEDELLRNKQAAERANRAKSDFLASMSHELRTPLNAIIGFSEVIRDAVFGPIGTPRYAEYAKDINDSGQHLLQIINDLLDLTKLEAGKVELHEERVAPAEVVGACLRLVRTRAEHSGVRLTESLPDDLPSVIGDPRLLKQILINLLSNAVKFTPRGGEIDCGVMRAAGGGLSFYVADTGIGMSAAEIEIALTPFGQVDGVLNRKHQGTGLGLPLARSLTELHGGEMAIVSDSGVGTRVTFTLPPVRVSADIEAPKVAAG